MTLRNRFLRIVLWFSNKTVPVDVFAKRYPISIKGVIIHRNKVLLLKNERGEWDLPGGKINSDFSAEDCLIREVKEETGLDIKVGQLLTTFIYNIENWINVFVLVYKCKLISSSVNVKISGEHIDYGFFSEKELNLLNMTPKHKKIIIKTLKR